MKPFTLLTLFFLLIIRSNSQNLYTHHNAASIENEQNTVTGWTGPAEIESEDDDPHNGQYAIKINSEDDGNYGQFSFDALPGTDYTITIWAKRGQSSNSEFDEWQGFTNFQKRNITGQGWKEYIFNLTANSLTPVIRVFASKNGSEDKTVFIDGISIYAVGGSGGGSGTGGPDVYHIGNANLPTVNWQALNFYSAGSVGIGTMPVSQFRLSVNGVIRTKELIVESGWSDFVFEPGYYLPSLAEVEKHIKEYGHLKDIPSEKEVLENGVEVGEINKLLLQKIEELTLYMIQADKQISEANQRISELESEIANLKE